MLEHKSRYISHNQYVTVLTGTGITGFLIFLFALVYPVIKNRGYRSYLFMTFFITALLSMFNEDTLETNTGICFFAFFYSLFLFSEESGEV